MESKRRKYIDRDAAYENFRFAKVFSTLGWIASGIQIGVFLLYLFVAIFNEEMTHHGIVGLVLSAVATVLSFVTMILSFVAKFQNKKLVFACTVLSVISATLAFCCLSHPYIGRFFLYVLPITFSGIFNLIATVFYANFWAKAHVDADDRCAYKAMSSDEKLDRDSKDIKKFTFTLIVSFCVFAITVSAVIPTEYFRNCNIVYDRMVYEMGHGRSGIFSEYLNINLRLYLEELPDGYRDTDKIKEEFKLYEKLESELSHSNTGVEARSALERMYGLKKIDDRWDFSGHNKRTRLYCDATWKSGEYYLTIGEEADRYRKQNFSTNLPYSLPDYVDEEIGELTVTGIYRQYYEWILGYELRYECDGEVYEFSINVCEIRGISYSLEDEEFVLRVYCYKTGTYYDMKLAE